MMHEPTSDALPAQARKALKNTKLQSVLEAVGQLFPLVRQAAVEKLPEFDALRDVAAQIKDHTFANLDFYLEAFEEKVERFGGHVHWARTAEEARQIVYTICKQEKARKVIKGKSMITEEIDLNAYLEDHDLEVVETDLGEYIIQLRGERPSHIIGPALHLTQKQISETFVEKHEALDPTRSMEDPQDLLNEAREILRKHFFTADIGITGANMLVAETGSAVVVSNEGNGGLSMTMPKTHIVVTSLDKIVPTLNDAATILRLLARSATGQELTTYSTFITGPKRAEDTDGPENFHVVLLDNGRSNMIGTEFQDVLRCIRCSACLNHCPVYTSIGGHAYGWVYPGPIGAALTPQLLGLKQARHLPNASTFCGKCEEVCPMRIPLTKMMRYWREKEFERHLTPGTTRFGLGAWAFLARNPRLYRLLSACAAWVLKKAAGRKGRLVHLPLAGGWTNARDMPAPEGKTFLNLWQDQKKDAAP